MNHTKKIVLLVPTAVLFLVGGVFAAVSLPFLDNFNYPGSQVTNDAAWTPTNSAAILSSGGIDGKYVSLTNDISLLVDSSQNYTNALVQIYCKPALVETAPASATGSSVACAFYVSASSNLTAISNDTWVTVGPANQFTTNWLGLSVHLDYARTQWDLYYTTNGYGTAMTKANAAPLKFNQYFAGNRLTNVVISTEAETLVDAVAVQSGAKPVDAGTEMNMVVHTQVLTALTETTLGFYGSSFVSGENTLDGGPLGTYLKQLLQEGDKIRVWLSTAGLVEYTFTGGALSGSPAASTVVVTPGMAVRIYPAATRTIYGMALPDPDNREPTTLWGTNTTVRGFTRLAWELGRSNSVVNTGANRWGFSGVAKGGDRIYLQDKDNSANYYVMFWDPAANLWKKSGNAAATGAEMKAGQQFFYYRPFSVVNGSWTNQVAQ